MTIITIAIIIFIGLIFGSGMCTAAGRADEQMERIMRKKTGAIEDRIIERRSRTMRNSLITRLWYRNQQRLAAKSAASLAVGQVLSGALTKPVASGKEAEHGVVEFTGSRRFCYGVRRLGSC
jgi:hypothetical protein